MKNIILFLILVILGKSNNAFAQSSMVPKYFINNKDTLPYLLKAPSINGNKNLPLIVWLHGSGERGNDNNKQYCNGLEIIDAFLDSLQYQAYLIAPQCPLSQRWANYDLKEDTHIYNSYAPKVQKKLYSLIKELSVSYPIDTQRIYLIGLSMGGYGVWDLITRYPGTFAAAIPICGGGDPKMLDKFCKTPIWAIHGEKDNVVNVSNTKNVMKPLLENNCNKTSHMTIEMESDHGVWYKAVNNPGLMPWLFSQNL